MSTTAIACELLTLNARSADLPFIAGGGSANAIVATAAADGWVVSPPSGQSFGDRVVFILGSDGSGGTVTFKAGDRYPAHRADLGDEIITLAANDGRVCAMETSRFLQDDGTILVIPSTTGLVMTAVMLPKAM
jgi:quercetin dioxygenase-like cupin family protein